MNRKQKNHCKLLGVSVSHFWIYVGCLGLGAALIVLAAALHFTVEAPYACDVLLGIGCGTIPTALTAYLIDLSNEKEGAKRRGELRSCFLWGAPHGVLWIMKTVIEEFSNRDEIIGVSFHNCFLEAVQNMESHRLGDNDDIKEYVEARERLVGLLDYGLRLCEDHCGQIADRSYEMEIHNVFTTSELSAIKYLREECETIRQAARINEMAEYIKLAVNEALDNIPEIQEKANRPIELVRRRVKNWSEITK